MRGSDFYGIQNVFCEYAGSGFRGYFPFAVQHGWQIAATEYESLDHPLEVWVWSERIKNEMSKHISRDKIRVVGAPYLYLPKYAGDSTEDVSSGIYIMPHSSHFAKIGFSERNLLELIYSLQKLHTKFSVLLYYLDVNLVMCQKLSRMGVSVQICGGLWTSNFLHNFQKLVTPCSSLYYSGFGSAVLYAQYEGVSTIHVPLEVNLIESTNVHVNALDKIFGKIGSRVDYDLTAELGLNFKLDASECSNMIAEGYRRVGLFKSFAKLLANGKNQVFDGYKNLRPAIRTVKSVNDLTCRFN